jgi:uncharacterized protein
MNELTVLNNEKESRFEIFLDPEYAHLDYRWYKGDLALMHTIVPEGFEGKGIASMLAKTALEYARSKNLKIMVYCTFVASYIKRHPEYAVLKDEKYHK